MPRSWRWRTGRKTVTCGALSVFEAQGEVPPEPGRVDIALDWSGRPALAVRTAAVGRIAFDKLTADRIADRGEFRDLADWRAAYEAYLRRNGHFAPDAVMVVERFEVVEDLSDD